jgi:hypothetical protein
MTRRQASNATLSVAEFTRKAIRPGGILEIAMKRLDSDYDREIFISALHGLYIQGDLTGCLRTREELDHKFQELYRASRKTKESDLSDEADRIHTRGYRFPGADPAHGPGSREG